MEPSRLAVGPTTVESEPRTELSLASLLERGFLLLTRLIAGASRFVFALPSVQFETATRRLPQLTRANAQAVCARSEGRIARTILRLKQESLWVCDKAVRDGELLWKGRGKHGGNVGLLRAAIRPEFYRDVFHDSDPVESAQWMRHIGVAGGVRNVAQSIP